ncbi:MAG TPA: hypothetical protein V6D03_01980, partial [Candidatus Caenarcaniphilales bacterium]
MSRSFLVSLLLLLSACQTNNPQVQTPSPVTLPQPALEQTRIQVSGLPHPYASESASRSPQVVDQPANTKLQVPPGFQVEVFAEALSRPRWLHTAPNGDVFLAESYDNRIRLLRDTNRDGKADQNMVFAEGLNQPFGMAIAPDGRSFYVANTDAVVRFPYQPGLTQLQG